LLVGKARHRALLARSQNELSMARAALQTQRQRDQPLTAAISRLHRMKLLP
jgi:hypothetical protein